MIYGNAGTYMCADKRGLTVPILSESRPSSQHGCACFSNTAPDALCFRPHHGGTCSSHVLHVLALLFSCRVAEGLKVVLLDKATDAFELVITLSLIYC